MPVLPVSMSGKWVFVISYQRCSGFSHEFCSWMTECNWWYRKVHGIKPYKSWNGKFLSHEFHPYISPLKLRCTRLTRAEENEKAFCNISLYKPSQNIEINNGACPTEDEIIDFVITGMHRSGTSFYCVLTSEPTMADKDGRASTTQCVYSNLCKCSFNIVANTFTLWSTGVLGATVRLGNR